MKTITTEQAYSIEGFIDNVIVSKAGAITVPCVLENPECYSMDTKEIQRRHDKFFQSFCTLPANTFVHKQTVFIRDKFQGKFPETFFGRAREKHFANRLYLRSICIMNFVSYDYQSISKAYTENPLFFRKNLIKSDREKLDAFLESVQTVYANINDLKDTSLRYMTQREIKNYIFDFVNGFHGDQGIRDIAFRDKIYCGEKKGVMFTICDENYLPEKMYVSVQDNTIEASNAELVMSTFERLGVHLPCTHVINEIWQFEGSLYRHELDLRVKLFGQHQEFGEDIRYKHKQLLDYQEEMIAEKNLMCRYNFNIMVLEDDDRILESCVDKIKDVFRMNDFKFYVPTFKGLYELYVANTFGREHLIPQEYLFLTDLHASLCFSLNYDLFRDDEEGIYFNDRIYQIPLRRDIWDAKKKRIPARNSIIVAATGGGKSVTALNIIQQNLEQNVKIVIVEFGKSFYQLGQLYPERALHVDYNGSEPLGINPFLLTSEGLTNAKIRILVQLILKFLRSHDISDDTAQVVSLTKLVQYYYASNPDHPSFPDFYHFIKNKKDTIHEELNIKEEYFDVNYFLHVGSEFIEGGIYENVCKYSDIEERIEQNDLVIFELTQIKKDPFLVSIIITILFDIVDSKILSDRSVRGNLVFDEYAETQAMKDMFSGEDMHSAVAFFYQKIRKENGAITTIIQSPAQLPENNYTKSMIGNTQLLYVLPTTETVYDQVIEAFHMKNESHINLMKSIKNHFAAEKPCSEVFIRFLDLYATAVRLELAPEIFLAFQTDGEVWAELQKRMKEHSSMEENISSYLQEKKNIRKKSISPVLMREND